MEPMTKDEIVDSILLSRTDRISTKESLAIQQKMKFSRKIEDLKDQRRIESEGRLDSFVRDLMGGVK